MTAWKRIKRVAFSSFSLRKKILFAFLFTCALRGFFSKDAFSWFYPRAETNLRPNREEKINVLPQSAIQKPNLLSNFTGRHTRPFGNFSILESHISEVNVSAQSFRGGHKPSLKDKRDAFAKEIQKKRNRRALGILRRHRIADRFRNTSSSWKEPKSSGKNWTTPYVLWEQVDASNHPKCNGVVPRKLVILNRTTVSTVEHLLHPKLRTLVVAPRFGLGNSLRGYVSSFIYSVLSGRKLVRFHGGFHFQTFDALCRAFVCNFDSIHWQRYKDPHKLWFKLGKIRPKPFVLASTMHKTGLRRSLGYHRPTILAHFANHFDGYWMEDKALSSCLHAVFKCKGVRNLWCIYSGALHALLGRGPSIELDETIKEIVRSADPLIHMAAPAQAADVASMFDVAIHLRTRSQRVESLSSMYGCRSSKCRQRIEARVDAAESRYAANDLWRCIGKVVRSLDKFLPARNRSLENGGYRIFLATDSEHLRPTFVKKLRELGTVYFSAGRVVHTSKAQDFASRLPTMAEFYLMSKAHVLLEAEEYVSTFANFAALFGNGTLVALRFRRAENMCRFRMVHRGVRRQSRG